MMLTPRKGFTLIELLIVVVLIGTLAMIAIPRFTMSRQKTFFAAMKADLRNAANAQEIYYSNHYYRYAGSAGQDANIALELEFASSQGVGITIQAAGSTGWSALATHAGLNFATQKCAMFYGNAPPLPPATKPGLINCMGEP